MNLKYNKAKKLLKTYNQLHVLKIIDKTNGKEKDSLIEQVNSIKWKDCILALKKQKNEVKSEDIQPIEYFEKSKIIEKEKNEYNKIGENIIKSNKYGVLILAGGQGTRLGHDGPKGTYKVNIGKEKSLFEIYFDEIRKYDLLYNIHIPVYIMTSKENEEQTQEYFAKNIFFNKKEDIVFFLKSKCQCMILIKKLL